MGSFYYRMGWNSVTDVDISVTVELNTIYDPGWGYVAWGNQTWGQSTEDMALAMPQPGNVDLNQMYL
jgi:hypothetical protein